MATGRQYFDACCAFLGEPYSTAPGRTSPTSGYKDCSGLVAAGFEVCQGYELGAYVSVTIFDQSARQGLEIPYDAARLVVGAVILRPQDPYQGWGSAGHIAVSDGAGGTVEATPPRVQRLPLSYNAPWSTRACLLPGLDYANNGEGAPAEPAPNPTPPGSSDMWALLALHGDTSTYLCGVGSAIIHDLHGKAMGLYALPENELKFVGWEPGGVTTKVVTSHTIELLRDLWPNVGDQG